MTTNSVKALYHIINKINEYIEESNENKDTVINSTSNGRIRCESNILLLLHLWAKNYIFFS